MFPWCAADIEGLGTIFSAYTERKRAQHLLDFEDLLLHWRAAVFDRDVGPVLAGGFDHVLVDEYQDTSVVQADILRALRSQDGRLTVVGDDAQAIYSFRAATVRNILDFPAHFSGATTITLDQNYRSTGPILDLANAVIAGSGEGHRKRLWTEDGGGGRPVLATCPDQQSQAEAVCQTILEYHESGIALKDQVVLFRTSHHSDLLEVELGRRNIPFVKFGGLRFLEAAHVRDLLAALRVVGNPWDELAWMRVVQMADGIGPASANRLVDTLGVRNPERDGPNPLGAFCSNPSGERVARRSVDDLNRIASGLDACRTGELPAGAQVEALRHALEPMIRRRYDHPEPRLADLDALAALASEYASSEGFVADLTMDPPRRPATWPESRPWMTIGSHSRRSTQRRVVSGPWSI